MAYKPIESYGIIGDMHSVALAGIDGSIDWCCLPHFDSPSLFAAILDDNKGGYFKIAVTGEATHKQMYLPESNVLVTRFLSPQGVGEITDFMPVTVQTTGEPDAAMHEIVRVARAVRGSVEFRLECYPAYDYARQRHQITMAKQGAVFKAGELRFSLISPVRLKREATGVVANFTLNAGETATFILRQVTGKRAKNLLDVKIAGEEALAQTAQYWRQWVARCAYHGRWREIVTRSALVLKLLTFQPTGAIIAAPTCSLPEEIGGVRNWDYRYTWIRDAAFTIYALLRLGYSDEAFQFMQWLEARVAEKAPVGPLQTLYGIDGRHELPESTLDHLDGYRGSKPVRIGNAASKQLQLDIYGELIDSIYLYNKYAEPISYEMWKDVREMLDWLTRNWKQPDDGIWEPRAGRRQNLYSKVQCWVALDRGVRMARRRGLPVDYTRLRKVQAEIYETTIEKGWDPKRNTFVQSFGSDALDASTLLMPLVLFISPIDPKMLSTLERIQQELVSDSLVHRYEIGKGAGDGLSGQEGTFTVCSFWLVEALTRCGRLDEARIIFEKMLTYANHLGLYAEEIGPCGEALGNFPQAFTHLGLISAAFGLNRKLDEK